MIIAINEFNIFNARASATGQFAICSRCVHSAEQMTIHGATIMCMRVQPSIPIGKARALGMPCGPLACCATRAEQTPQAPTDRVSLQVTQSSNASAWRDIAAQLGACK